MEIYKGLASPMLDRLDSETSHVIVREALHFAETFPGGLKIIEQFAYKRKRFLDPKLRVQVCGIEFDNPLVMGAGWDKEGRAVKGLWRLGVAGVEAGGVPEYPQEGNPRPRQFVVAPGVIIQRLGFNSSGMNKVARNLSRYERCGIPIGIQVTENRDVASSDTPEDHAKACVAVTQKMYHIASWFTLGLSSPNTPGMRRLQGKRWLAPIVSAVFGAMEDMGGRKPLFVKIAPDLTWEELDEVIEVASAYRAGIVASNTTTNPDIKAKYGERWRYERGGLSGDDSDFRAMSTRQIAYICRATGNGLPVMGAGGIKDTPTALEKIMAGALPLQIVSAIRGEGLTVFGRINRGIVEFMDREGVKSLKELVGVEANIHSVA
ncbi:MAG: dihydroorotate dehydrogenase (quinone) [Candidatus Spechtbacteria bacterium]|nr:dihydroorotate dehydrogenase (quinone) [Candidatus Spechtbacteria bacterium]